MKQILLTCLMVGLMTPAGLYAQKVYAENGKAILDMTVAAGMPVGAVTSISKTVIFDTYTEGIAENTENGSNNATVYQKLEISLMDKSATTGIRSTWSGSYSECLTSTEGGNSDWRLPTQRELQMIAIFRTALDEVIVKLGGVSLRNVPYTCWTEVASASSYCWTVNMFDCGTDTSPKSVTGSQRCVREL